MPFKWPWFCIGLQKYFTSFWPWAIRSFCDCKRPTYEGNIHHNVLTTRKRIYLALQWLNQFGESLPYPMFIRVYIYINPNKSIKKNIPPARTTLPFRISLWLALLHSGAMKIKIYIIRVNSVDIFDNPSSEAYKSYKVRLAGQSPCSGHQQPRLFIWYAGAISISPFGGRG